MLGRGHRIHYQGCKNIVLKYFEDHELVRGILVKRSKVGPVTYDGNKVYYPDIRVLTGSGKQVVLECKSVWWLGIRQKDKGYPELFEKNLLKFKAAHKQFRKGGVEFVLELVHNREIHWIRKPHLSLYKKVQRILGH